MAFMEYSGIRVAGLAAAVPKETEENSDYPLFHGDEAEKFMASTGVHRRHVSQKWLSSDLCCSAAERLLADLAWERSSIDGLVFVTQMPDYILPATACVLQHRLGLSEECAALDVSLGCSGWVYGMTVASGWLVSGCRRVLLLCGETSHTTSREDKSTWPLFGEAGTVTALERSDSVAPIWGHFATDGSGYKAIIIPDGGFRNRFSAASLEVKEVSPGISRSALNTVLEGMDVFSFGISRPPQSVRKLCDRFGIDLESVDYAFFHQANLFLNEKIRKKLKLPPEKVPYCLESFGNTSSASIPLLMVTELRESLQDRPLFCLGCGFGVGLSWGTIAFRTDCPVVSELVEL